MYGLTSYNNHKLSFFRRIAGLNDKKARAILAWREERGSFTNREQLKEVRGIGLKSYEQCVGFVRIINATRLYSNTSKPSVSAGLSSTAVNSSNEAIVVLDSDEEEKLAARGKKRKGDSAETGAKKKRKTKNGTQEFCANPLDMTWIHPESYPVAQR